MIYNYDEKDGYIVRGRNGQPEKRLTHMGKSFLAPCRNPEKGCPKGTPENPRSLNAMNQQAYDHYRECRVMGEFPDDPMVRQNAVTITDAIERAERKQAAELRETLVRLAVR